MIETHIEERGEAVIFPIYQAIDDDLTLKIRRPSVLVLGLFFLTPLMETVDQIGNVDATMFLSRDPQRIIL